MNAVKPLLIELGVHTTLWGLYVALLASSQNAGTLVLTVLGFVVMGTTFTLVHSLLSSRLAPLEPSLRTTEEGRRELLWRTANKQPRLLAPPGWPSWTLNLYRYATFGFGSAAVLAAFVYVTRSSEALTFAAVPVIAGLIGLLSSLPLLAARTVFERWGVAHPEQVDTPLASPKAKAGVKSASS